MLAIYDYLVDVVEKHLDNRSINGRIESKIGRTWHYNRYIKVIPVSWNSSFYFEYCNGCWELRFEIDDISCDAEKFRRFLIDCFEVTNEISWHRWYGRQRGRLRYEYWIETVEEFTESFDNLYDAVIEYYYDWAGIGRGQDDVFDESQRIKNVVQADSNIENIQVKDREYKEPEVAVKSVSNLNFNKFSIPEYQRPYKWKARNVNQLIDDILRFKDKNEYRLGTLVLHDTGDCSEIVDGQQRIITLSLLLKVLFEIESYRTVLSDLLDNVERFTSKTCFSDNVTKNNLRDNLQVIRQRITDIDEATVRFIVNNCKFVVVTLYDISEAFQFFDSQNARGKELSPHDLLKAFHLRNIPKIEADDKRTIEVWEDYNDDDLSGLFLVLFRIKRWINTNEGRFFTNKDIDVFKGISADSKLPYQRIFIMADCFAKLYNQDVSRLVDNSHMDYPHQIDQVVVNGRLFFDMVGYYDNLYKELIEKVKNFDIIRILNNYPQRKRAGDTYVRELFDAALLYYYDKFGMANIELAVMRIFVWAYSLRLTSFSVQLASVDNYARNNDGSFFTFLHQAVLPHELLNWNIPIIKESDIRRSELNDIINKMQYLKYVQ